MICSLIKAKDYGDEIQKAIDELNEATNNLSLSLSPYDTLSELACYIKTNSDANKTTNCPNCGAPITSSKCDYCGTDFEASAMWGMAR